MTPLVVLVTGGRAYPHPANVLAALDRINPDIVIHGNSGNVDLAARGWARWGNKLEHAYPYFGWLGKTGGPARNLTMVSALQLWRTAGARCEVHAWPGGTGTEGCKRLAREAGFQPIENT